MTKLIIAETNLDGELKELAVKNWPEFASLIGHDAIVTAKVCHLKRKGKSIKKIATKLRITKSQVETRCKRCPKS